MQHRIRLCRRSDLQTVTALERAAFGTKESLPLLTFAQYYDLFQKTFLVATKRNRIVGMAIGGIVTGHHQKAWILDIVCQQTVRHQGVGLRLGQELIKRLKHQGAKKLYATVAPKNNPSQRLLRRLGFCKSQYVANYFGAGEHRFIMTCRL